MPAEATHRMAMGQINNFPAPPGEPAQRWQSWRIFQRHHHEFGQQPGRQPLTIDGRQGMGSAGDPFLMPTDGAMTNPSVSGNAAPGGVSFWAGGAVNFGKLQPGASDNGIDFTTSGLSLGADKQVSQTLTLGVGAGYGHDVSDVGQHGSRSAVDSYNVAVYGSYQPGEAIYVDALAGYQWLQFDARRFVTDNGNTVHGSRDGKQWFASLSVGYQHPGEGHDADALRATWTRLARRSTATPKRAMRYSRCATRGKRSRRVPPIWACWRNGRSSATTVCGRLNCVQSSGTTCKVPAWQPCATPTC